VDAVSSFSFFTHLFEHCNPAPDEIGGKGVQVQVTHFGLLQSLWKESKEKRRKG
jgi:hypothetical protein